MQIVGHPTRASRVTIFEPRQTPEQEEVILDVLDMAPGEARDYPIRSATAGYRVEDNAFTLPEDDLKPAPDSEYDERTAHPATLDEINAGRDAHEEAKRREEGGETSADAPVVAETTEDEVAAGEGSSLAEAIDEPIVIPDDWENEHWRTQVKLAHELGAGPDVNTKAEAEAFIRAEVARRHE